jgi:phage repressor protein C with HTH and peptisase S24 domain
MATDNVYALEITGDSMEPVYRRGDRIVVAPGMTVRKGDRVVVKTKDARSELAWMARILWASQ